MMTTSRQAAVRLSWTAAVALLFAAAVLALALTGCGGPEPTPQVIVVTATFTPEPEGVVATVTLIPVPEVEPTETPSAVTVQATGTPLATATADVEDPTKTALPPTATLLVRSTEPPPPSAAPTEPEPSATAAEPGPTETTEPVAEPLSLGSYFVVYTAYKGPDLQDYSLWGMNGDGSGVFQIEGAGRASEPAFSPDGNKLAFYHWTDGIYIWDLDQETSTRIVGNTEASFATWSPNGKRLAYTDLYGQPQVYLVNQDGSNNQPLTPGLRPNWSLEGGFIGYDSCENNRCGIFRINPDGGGKRQLTEDGGGGAAVSPNGKRIAYWSKADGDFEIYAINADGSGRSQLTKNEGNDALPAWSPDGQIIYYLSDQNGKSWAVMAMNADGSDKRKIVGTSAGNDPVRGWQYQRITVTWNE